MIYKVHFNIAFSCLCKSNWTNPSCDLLWLRKLVSPNLPWSDQNCINYRRISKRKIWMIMPTLYTLIYYFFSLIFWCELYCKIPQSLYKCICNVSISAYSPFDINCLLQFWIRITLCKICLCYQRLFNRIEDFFDRNLGSITHN